MFNLREVLGIKLSDTSYLMLTVNASEIREGKLEKEPPSLIFFINYTLILPLLTLRQIKRRIALSTVSMADKAAPVPTEFRTISV